MIALLIFVVVLGSLVAFAAQRGPEDSGTGKGEMSTGQKIALGIAVVIGALGLFVVGLATFFVIGMSNWANNK